VAKRTPDFDFEQALKELEAIVERMEKGELGLEESLRHFERGIGLTRACQKALAEADQKVHVLLERDDGQSEILPFASD
jgi:exodeoxyribonuclease VII small subunit